MQRFLLLGTGGPQGSTFSVPDPTEQTAGLNESVYVDDLVSASRVDEGLGDVETASVEISIIIETP